MENDNVISHDCFKYAIDTAFAVGDEKFIERLLNDFLISDDDVRQVSKTRSSE